MTATVPLTISSRPQGLPAREQNRHEREYQAQFQPLYSSRYVDFPEQVGLETFAWCNASCGFCPFPTMERKGERMSDELIAKIMRDLRDIPRDLPFKFYPERVNEPFLDKRLWDVMAQANEELPNAQLCLFTNASTLNDSTLNRLSNVRNIEMFNISFNDHRPEEYERLMGLNYARTVAHIDALHARWRAGTLGFNFTISRVSDGTDADVQFRRFVEDRWPGITVWLPARMDWIGRVSVQQWSPAPVAGCRQWFGLHFLASGKDAFCCIDHDAQYGYGNAANAHVLELYNHPKRRALRERILMRQEVDLCAGCVLWA